MWCVCVFKATLLISRAFCKHQLIQAAHGSAAVDSRKQLKENTPKAVTAHSPNSNSHSAARERLQTEGKKFSLLPWERFQASAACEHRHRPWEKGLSANCKPVVLCEHLSLSRSPRALRPALYRVSDSCQLLQAHPSASCHGETEMEKPQLLLAGSCQTPAVERPSWDRQAPACSKGPQQRAASHGWEH